MLLHLIVRPRGPGFVHFGNYIYEGSALFLSGTHLQSESVVACAGHMLPNEREEQFLESMDHIESNCGSNRCNQRLMLIGNTFRIAYNKKMESSLFIQQAQMILSRQEAVVCCVIIVPLIRPSECVGEKHQ